MKFYYSTVKTESLKRKIKLGKDCYVFVTKLTRPL